MKRKVLGTPIMGIQVVIIVPYNVNGIMRFAAYRSVLSYVGGYRYVIKYQTSTYGHRSISRLTTITDIWWPGVRRLILRNKQRIVSERVLNKHDIITRTL